MIKEIKMPNLGTTTDEMKIMRWLKKENEQVKRGEVLFEVETDKATMEVESYLSGYLKKIIIEADGMAETDGVVAYIGDESDIFEKTEEPAKADIKTESKIEQKKQSSIRISPMVKKIAEKLNVDYTVMQGTGAGGMITKTDIENAADTKEKDSSNIVKFNKIAKATAKAMTLSKSTIPHVYFDIEVNTSAMMQARLTSGKKISYNAMIIKAVSDSIEDYPYLAAKYSEEGRVLADKLNVGLAVAREDGLFVPVIKDVGKTNMLKLEDKINDLVKKVIKDTLQQSDITSGGFTVTNLGGFGIDSFSAVINPPEAAILAVGRIADKVVPVDGEIKIQPYMKLTLSVDHRVVNGAYAAKFLQALKANLERV